MLKDIEPTKVRNGVKNNVKVYVKAFPGATTNHMKSYANPSKEFNNDLIILHCGTNDLRSNKQPTVIAKDITELAMDLQSEKMILWYPVLHQDVIIWIKKLSKLKLLLQSLCSDHNIHTIDNSNIKTNFHLNNSGLHLNYAGTYVLGGNIVNAMNIWHPSYTTYVCNDKLTHNNPQNIGLFNDKTCPFDKIGNSIEDTLTNLKASKENGVKIAHLNINFLYNKFEGLKLLIQDKIDVLVLCLFSIWT